MAHNVQLACFFTLLTVLSADKDQSRWSRQISSYTADISDWVPLAGPVEREPQPSQIKRQAVAEPRILSDPFPGFVRPAGFSQESFPSRMFINSPVNRQLYLQSVPSAPQNYLTDQGFGQSIRFGLAQPNLPMNQMFVAPQYNFDSFPQIKARPTPVPSTQFKFDNIPIQNQPIAPQAKPFVQAQKTNIELPKFVDGYRIENITRDVNFAKKKPQSIPKIKFDVLDKTKIQPVPQGKPKVEREEVRLLYVPLESLNRGQFNFRSPLTTSQLVNTELFSQNPRLNPLNPLKQNVASDFQNTMENFKIGQNQFSNYNGHFNGFDQRNKYSTLSTPIITIPTTTPKPKKLKPHQPPLAIFLTQESKKDDQIKVGDVLFSLKNADTVAVLDSVNPANAPKVFIGPNSLTPPENYVRFELPYLSNIENIDKKLRQLPFFVAPLSYKTPQGFAKIPFPSPHVGSVVINSQISPPVQPSTVADVIPNSYTAPPQYRPKEITQKPRFSYYSTAAPQTNAPLKQEPNYYSFEPQSVSTIKPVKESSEVTSPPKSGSYFLNNRYNPSQYVNFPQETDYKTQDYTTYRTFSEPTTTTTTTTTTKPPSPYTRPLLETHNPYSINQAFHFSTPVDYQNFFDEYKENYATPGTKVPPAQENVVAKPTEKPYEEKVEKTQYQSSSPSYEQSYNEKSVKPQYQTPQPVYEQTYVENPKQKQYQPPPTYEQNYTPEIQYQSEIQPSRYPTQSTNDYTTNNEPSSDLVQTNTPVDYNENYVNSQPQLPLTTNDEKQYEGNLPSTQHSENKESVPPTYENLTEPPTTFAEQQPPKTTYEYNQYETIATEEKETTTSTTTTTRRTPLRTRTRPRYSTTKSDNEYTTRSYVTRKPLRERRPLPTRPRYEPNKVTTEKSTTRSYESNESTTKSARTRSRGRVHYKHTEADDIYDKKTKQNGKEEDLAYQRDVLHQNYPVTLMERMSTVDIEAMTEPTLKASSDNNLDSTNTYDTDNAYSNDQLSITQHTKVYTENKQDQEYSRPQIEENTYVPRISSTRAEDYIYHSRSSSAPIDAFSSYDETKEEENYSSQTTPIPKTQNTGESLSAKTVYSSEETVHPEAFDSNDEVPSTKHEDVTTVSDTHDTKVYNQEIVQEQEEPEENIVQTTPSYNRVRVRPGVVRQYHQASSTESARVKNDRRKAQAITYRPAFDRRRTTMRIDEIEADLKTKQANSRLENQEVHPVYKPEPSTEATVLSPTQDSSSKRGQFRRRRPTYTSSSTESISTKRTPYEVKNRFRGRRPTTEKPIEKNEGGSTEATTSTTRTLYYRYSHRPRLSERYHKKPETETAEDQDSNYSLHRPKYAVPDADHWSPKFSSDSFKPYNPNDVSDDTKSTTTEHKSNNELDIITAKNEYDDILISVTPATNNNKVNKIPDIPPTLEALVEQSKVTKSESGDAMSTFESMLEEVMKSLEEQDQDEYTTNVMKHKGGEIGEIPPEKIISSGETYSLKSSAPTQEVVTTFVPTNFDSTRDENEDASRKSRRRGFWKKVKVRPVTESIEVAESQYYPNTVNRLGQSVQNKEVYGKSEENVKPRVTTYKPNQEFMQNLFANEDEPVDALISHLDIPKISSTSEAVRHTQDEATNRNSVGTTTVSNINPGDMDLGTGSPDPTLEDEMYYSEPTETTISDTSATVDRSDGFSLMDYFFGVTASDDATTEKNKTEPIKDNETTKSMEIESSTEQKSKMATTETTYIPEEITDELAAVEYDTTENVELLKTTTQTPTEERIDPTEKSVPKIETSSISSFMDQMNIVSTSMSTEVSHETEICFRGKCIKTNKDVL